MFSLLGLIWSLHPLAAVVVVVLSLVYYFVLSPPFGVGMLLMASVMLWVLTMMPQVKVLPMLAVVFVIAWIGQFIGHKIEGKKPAFFDDLRFLLIGPVFVLSFLYRRLGISY
jgi:uncharacterized membrane protein YGL010W